LNCSTWLRRVPSWKRQRGGFRPLYVRFGSRPQVVKRRYIELSVRTLDPPLSRRRGHITTRRPVSGHLSTIFATIGSVSGHRFDERDEQANADVIDGLHTVGDGIRTDCYSPAFRVFQTIEASNMDRETLWQVQYTPKNILSIFYSRRTSTASDAFDDGRGRLSVDFSERRIEREKISPEHSRTCSNTAGPNAFNTVIVVVSG
jgi:hypothetical protein